MSKNKKIAIIGCGKQAFKHIESLRKFKDFELVLHDNNKQVGQLFSSQTGLEFISSASKIFEDPSIIAVDICTPTPSHTSLVVSAIQHNKYFFVEKPICETLEEAKVIRDIAKLHEPLGLVGYIYRFSPVFQRFKKILQGSEVNLTCETLGKISFAHFRIGGRGSHAVWKHRKDLGGGAINEMLVHMIDLSQWLFGEIIDIELLYKDLIRPTRVINGNPESVDAEDYILTRLCTKRGLTLFCQADLLTPAFTQYLEVQGDNGTLMGSIQDDLPSWIFCNKPTDSFEIGKTTLEVSNEKLFDAQMAEFIQLILGNDPVFGCSIFEALNLVDLIQKLK